LSDEKKTEICEVSFIYYSKFAFSLIYFQQFLELCQSKNGGFGGGPLQMPHLATTYAAMNAIAILGANGFNRAYEIVNVDKMKTFLNSVKDRHQKVLFLDFSDFIHEISFQKKEDGSFAMHVNGEKDTRAIYCAASVATMLQLKTDELFENTPQYLALCQSWDGGFGPNPGAESHGYVLVKLSARFYNV
jgi:protein farnesyltransferase subunit beta